jgi:hypothetical protein
VTPRVGIREGAKFNGAVSMPSAVSAGATVPKAARSPQSTDEPPLNERVVDRMLNRQ